MPVIIAVTVAEDFSACQAATIYILKGLKELFRENEYRTQYCNAVTENDIGKKVRAAGWVENIRDHGVGGYTVEALVRSGVGAIDVIDDDKVCLTNLNRQIIATRKTIGQYKTDVCKERIHDINPNCEVTVHKCFFLPETKDQFDFSKYDYVVDAVDTVTAKIALVMACQEAGTPIISSMGAGNKLNPAEFEVADIYKTSVCPLAKVMRRELKKRNVKHLKVVYSKEKPVRPIEDMGISCRTNCICPPGAAHKCTERRDIPGSTAFVPSVVGLIIASEVIKDITHDAMVKTRHENGVDIEG